MTMESCFCTASSHAIFLLSREIDEALFAEGIVVCSAITPKPGREVEVQRAAAAGIPHDLLQRRWWVTHGGVEGLARLRAAVEAAGVEILPDVAEGP